MLLALNCSASSSSSGNGRASLFSTPLTPTTDGRDKDTSDRPYSPSNGVDTGTTAFSSKNTA